MAGSKTNTVTYVFEGDTLNLEQAIKRVQSLMRGTVKALKEQEGGMSEVEKAQYKQLRSLMKTIRTLNEKSGSLTDAEKKQLNNAMKRALSISNSLYKSKLRIKDKERKETLKRNKKEVSDAEKHDKELEFARTPEAQVRAHSQLAQLSRLRGFMNASDPAEADAIQNLDAVISEYNKAKEAFDAGTGSQERLAAATVALDEKYKELAGSLNRLSSEQNKANHGEGKSTFLQFLAGKTKSLTIYKLIKAVLAKIAESIKKAFQKIAQANQPFNDAMSRLTSSFQLLADKIATVLAPVLQLIVPLFKSIVSVIGQVTDKLAEMFSAIAGNDAWAQATYQVEDYAEATKKVKQPEGIDELNKLNTDKNNIVNVEVEDKFKSLKALGEEIKKIFEMVSTTIGPILQPLVEILALAFQLIGSIATALEPLFNLITLIVTALSGAIGGVLTFLIENILAPIVTWLSYIISHMELLIPLMIALLMLWAAFGWKSFVASLAAVAKGFVSIATSIYKAIAAAYNWVVQGIKTIAHNIKQAVSAWIAEKAYWKLALAVIAAAGIAAIAVAAIVGVAVAAGGATMASNMGDNPANVALAAGGVVAAPTLALVGEGKYPEAVVPLGQSPQFQSMKEGIAAEVVSMMNSNRSQTSLSSNRPIILQLNGKELARALLPDLGVAYPQMGVKLR